MINGSARAKGNTFRALTEIAKRLETHAIESEIVQIGSKPIHGCVGCSWCKREAIGKCVFNDDICNAVSAKFAEASALIVGSPVYYGQPNGAVLSLVQRAFFSNGEAVRGKPAAAVAICRRGGATAAFETLNMPFQMMNMPVITSQYWNILYGREVGEVLLDAEGLQTMRTLADNLAWLLKRTNGEPAPGLSEEWQPMHFIR